MNINLKIKLHYKNFKCSLLVGEWSAKKFCLIPRHCFQPKIVPKTKILNLKSNYIQIPLTQFYSACFVADIYFSTELKNTYCSKVHKQVFMNKTVFEMYIVFEICWVKQNLKIKLTKIYSNFIQIHYKI